MAWAWIDAAVICGIALLVLALWLVVKRQDDKRTRRHLDGFPD